MGRKFLASMVSGQLIFEMWSAEQLTSTKFLKNFLNVPVAIKLTKIIEQDLLYNEAQRASVL